MKLEFVRIMGRKKLKKEKNEILLPIQWYERTAEKTIFNKKNGHFSRLNVCVKYQTIIDVCRVLKRTKNQCILNY